MTAQAKKARPNRAPPPPEPQSRARTWAVLAQGELERPGATLLALILDAANTRGLTMRQLAKEALGVSYSYLAALRSGEKEIPKVGDDVITKAAAFLQLPKVAAMLAAGQLTLGDFYQDRGLLQTYLTPALQFIQRDADLGPHMPPDVFTSSIALQQFVILLYERATRKTLIPSKVSLDEIVDRYEALLEGETAKR